MQNDSYQIINLFGEDIPVKNYLCSNIPDETKHCDIKLNLYVKLSDACNAKCLFCSNANLKDNGKFDVNKLKYVVEEMDRVGIINRISLTGGEPMLNLPLLNNVLNTIFMINPDFQVTINTNGIHLLDLPYLDAVHKIDGIHLSRHHYDDAVNNSILGFKTVSFQEIDSLMNHLNNKKLLRLNCLLMKDYINSITEVEHYLEHASKLDVFRVGFVSLMKSNFYCEEQFINFNDIFFKDAFPSGKGQVFVNYYDKSICECTNGAYVASNGNFIEFYSRMTKEVHCPYVRQFVYTSDNRLTLGFGKEILL